MSFGENLKLIRKERNVTQEQLAEMLNVSRQAVSKWESGNGYPETEKLLIISKELNVSLDDILNNNLNINKKEDTEQKATVYPPSGKIAIPTFDNKNIIMCQSVKSSEIMGAKKGEPRYILSGIDKVSFWGEHSIILGWYETLEDVNKEIKDITNSIYKGENVYELKYFMNIELVGFFGQPKVKK